jgi:hypothetical protein
MHGPLILHTPPTLVYCMVMSVFQDILNLKPLIPGQ